MSSKYYNLGGGNVEVMIKFKLGIIEEVALCVFVFWITMKRKNGTVRVHILYGEMTNIKYSK